MSNPALACVLSRGQNGLHAPEVRIEVHVSTGLPAFMLVGLPEAEVRESRDRVRSALINSGFIFPNRRITVNLAPADLPKEGGRFDLAIALGVLIASGQLSLDAPNPDFWLQHEFYGELSLSGALAPIRGALPAALAARQSERQVIMSEANAAEVSLLNTGGIWMASHLREVCDWLMGEATLMPATPPATQGEPIVPEIDLRDVRGQFSAKRALEIAAAGGHSMLMLGPPGSGKTMLAARLPNLLPPMTTEQALEVAAIASISSSGFDLKQWAKRPFRSPHHTASGVALVGGGSQPRPGEITLAHHGVLFLDELPEFDRRVLEVLREPLESGHITISRAARQAEFPAQFQLIAAMNPCPCGYLGDPIHACKCSLDMVARYRGKISGPLLDRIDLHIVLPRVKTEELLAQNPQNIESTAQVSERVAAARTRQLERQGYPNAQLQGENLMNYCVLDENCQKLLHAASDRLGLSARGYHRILRVARTIADLSNVPNIQTNHLAEAIQMRQLDRGKS